MRCLPFMPEQVRIGKTWWKTSKGLWISSLLTAMGVAHLRTTSTGIGQTSQMICLTPPTHFLQNSLTTRGAPLALIADEAIDVEVGQGGATGDSKRGVVAKEYGLFSCVSFDYLGKFCKWLCFCHI